MSNATLEGHLARLDALPDRLEVGLRKSGKGEERVEQLASGVLHDVSLVLLEGPQPGRHEHLRCIQVVRVGVLQPRDPRAEFRRISFASHSLP